VVRSGLRIIVVFLLDGRMRETIHGETATSPSFFPNVFQLIESFFP